MADEKILFSAFPDRIFSDPRPKLTHYRVLGPIGLHDQRSLEKGEGQGCWASLNTIARALGMKRPNVSRAVNDLVEWGYLKREPRKNKQGWVLRIIYDAPPYATTYPVCPDIPPETTPETFDGGYAPTYPPRMPPHTKPVCPDIPKEIIEKTHEVDSAEAERANALDASKEDPSRFDTSHLSAADIAAMIERICPYELSQSELAKRSGVRPQHVTAAKKGEPTTPASASLIAAECERINFAIERGERFDPMPTLPSPILRRLPKGFFDRNREGQIPFVGIAIQNGERRGELATADRAQVLDWLNWVADRDRCDPVVSEARRLCLVLSRNDAQDHQPERNHHAR